MTITEGRSLRAEPSAEQGSGTRVEEGFPADNSPTSLNGTFSLVRPKAKALDRQTVDDAPVVGMEATPDNGGYWLVASDRGIFAFRAARFFGSMGGEHLNAPVVGMERACSRRWRVPQPRRAWTSEKGLSSMAHS